MGSNGYTEEIRLCEPDEEIVYTTEYVVREKIALLIEKHITKCKVCLNDEACSSLHDLFEEGYIMIALAK